MYCPAIRLERSIRNTTSSDRLARELQLGEPVISTLDRGLPANPPLIATAFMCRYFSGIPSSSLSMVTWRIGTGPRPLGFFRTRFTPRPASVVMILMLQPRSHSLRTLRATS
jgi:hypothetical protein